MSWQIFSGEFTISRLHRYYNKAAGVGEMQPIVRNIKPVAELIDERMGSLVACIEGTWVDRNVVQPLRRVVRELTKAH